MKKCIYTLSAGAELPAQQRRELFGGKGASLVDMAGILKLPVPPAVILTTEAGRSYLNNGLDATLREAVCDAISNLEVAANQTFGAASNALVVSVRSSGYHSMPGMMDTVLNIGMTTTYCAAATTIEVARHRLQCLAMLLGGLIGNSPESEINTIRTQIKKVSADAAGTSSMKGCQVLLERLRRLADGADRSILLASVEAQLMAAVEAVFESWSSHRAMVYREREGIAHGGGTAAIIQCMVFGNRDENSGTGVIFSRDPNTGDAAAYGDFVRCAQGEVVVSGAARDTMPISNMGGVFPEQHRRLQQALRQLEHHYRDMVDVEFTIDGGILWILQARPGKRSPLAALRIAYDLASDDAFGLSAEEIHVRIDPGLIRQVAVRVADVRSASVLANGIGVARGMACGAIYMTPDDAEAAIERDERILYVRRETAPDDVPIMAEAEGVITSSGGTASHAAVIARAWGKPTVVGVGSMSHAEEFVLFDGIRINRGEILTIDGSSGAIYRGEIDGHYANDDAVAGLIAWAEHYLS